MKKGTIIAAMLSILSFLLITILPCQADDIYGCYPKKGGRLRIVGSPGKCKKSEYAVTVNGTSSQTQAVDPIVGHWSFMQYTDGTSGSINPQSNPNVCVGDLDINPDLTYTAWNTCRIGDDPALHTETYSGSDVQRSPGFYIFGSYVVLLSKSGNVALYNDLLNNNPGHYEHGFMLKDVVIDHSALQQ